MKNKSIRFSRLILAFYIALLFISHLVSFFRQTEPTLFPGQKSITITNKNSGEPVRIAYFEKKSESPEAKVLLLLHGSPFGSRTFRKLIEFLPVDYRVIAPDLPGYGGSTEKVADYSFRSHAIYIENFLEKLSIQRTHVLAYSYSGGVALRLEENNSSRVESLILVSAIGVQEYELTGDYFLNHALHSGLTGIVWLLHNAVPHMGYLDRFPIDMAFARSFYDADQRPLRDILNNYSKPMLIMHGSDDSLVPVNAAEEHSRIVPQSVIKWYEDGHEIVFRNPALLVPDIVAFLEDVEEGSAITKESADSERIASSHIPFEAIKSKSLGGFAVVILLIMIALGTFISEDLASIGAGVLAARGVIGFIPAVAASFIGIYVGDILLFFAGRYLGRPAIGSVPFKWLIKDSDIEKSSQWFRKKGKKIIIASRFLPGTRLTTYLTAGILRTDFWTFSLYFLAASLLWTPLLVGFAYSAGYGASSYFEFFENFSWWRIALLFSVILIALKFLTSLTTFRGRRLLVSRWIRITHWEFWPLYIFYPPVVIYVLYLGLKHRSLTLFTAANPTIPQGGFKGESKHEILTGLSGAGEVIARHVLLKKNDPVYENMRRIIEFTDATGYPIILKPDRGERGAGVEIVRSPDSAKEYLEKAVDDTILQEYVPGLEFGVFYYRMPNENTGKIFSITEKKMMSLTGDGEKTIEELILSDARAICMAKFHLDSYKGDIFYVPEVGEEITLVELGTHCRGSVFLNGDRLITNELTQKTDEISKVYEGFYFGRYDIRASSVEDFRLGKNLKVLELNGVTSEATGIYDPSNSLFSAYRTLMKQWLIAFEISEQNVQNGAKTSGFIDLIRVIWE